MNLYDLRFAKVNFDYDRERAFKEAEALMPHTRWAIGAPYMKEQTDMPFSIAPESETAAMLHGKALTWKVISLRQIEGVPESTISGSSIRNRNVDRAWIWRDDITYPYLREIVDRLPFKKLHSVRFLALPPGHAGGVHHDDPLDMFYKQIPDDVNVTFNLSSGGSCLQFWQDEQIYEVSDYPAFLFRDDCWHGVPLVKDLRIQMRVHGTPAPEFAELVDKTVRLLVANISQN